MRCAFLVRFCSLLDVRKDCQILRCKQEDCEKRAFIRRRPNSFVIYINRRQVGLLCSLWFGSKNGSPFFLIMVNFLSYFFFFPPFLFFSQNVTRIRISSERSTEGAETRTSSCDARDAPVTSTMSWQGQLPDDVGFEPLPRWIWVDFAHTFAPVFAHLRTVLLRSLDSSRRYCQVWRGESRRLQLWQRKMVFFLIQRFLFVLMFHRTVRRFEVWITCCMLFVYITT